MKPRIFFLLFLLWLLCIVLEIQFSFGFVGFYHIILLILLYSVVIFILGIVIYLRAKQSNFLKLGIIMLAFCLTEMMISGKIVEWQRSQTYSEANVIINAIGEYYTTNNDYPNSLNELIPDFLDSIPKTKMGWFGTDFHYSKLKEDDYRLSFDYHVFIACYSSKDIEWFCDD